MSHRIPACFSGNAQWRFSLPLLLGLALPAVYAQTPVQERAVTWAAEDTNIKWGPCPPFLPAGCGIAVLLRQAQFSPPGARFLPHSRRLAPPPAS